mgnify:CR=1 FL=1
MISQVVIPSAGIGSRLGNLTEHVNKAMIQIDGKKRMKTDDFLRGNKMQSGDLLG